MGERLPVAGIQPWKGFPEAEIVGYPLNSTLAELLGYRVAHEEWPVWIDRLAEEVAAS